MRRIERTAQFKRDYKREKRGRHRTWIDEALLQYVEWLAKDEQLPEHARDHALSGEWKDFRDCHVRPDLVLIYSKLDDDTLQLVRLGSHSELGL